MVLDAHGFEAAIVRHCSPTLAGIKPGCLFNVPGMFAADLTEEPAVQLDQWRQAHELCEKLERLVAKTSIKLIESGVCINVIARRHCGALIYVWRPAMLARAFSDPLVAEQLTLRGYDLSTMRLDPMIERLGARLEQCHRRDPEAGFPHEIGFFLGYPFADVMGFIEHEGQDYLLCGCWKVYQNPEGAQECFERYKRCTMDFEQKLANGTKLQDLVQRDLAA